MKTFKLELTGDQISWMQHLMDKLCDDHGGYSELDPVLQDLSDKLYSTK